MIELLKGFFAPRDVTLYPPSGMFTTSHIVALIITIIVVIVSLFFSRKITKEKIKLLCKIFAIVFTILEGIKITYNLVNGYTWLDAWFPLAYCSLFIYSLYLAGFGKNKIEKVGFSYLCGGGILAGSFFLIFPTTSLMLHPIYHYLCIYSMLFHGAMIYFAILTLTKKAYIMSLKDSLYYLIYLAVASLIAIAINNIFDCNMMFYKEPYNMPITFVIKIFEFSKVAYTILIFIAYSSLYFITYLGYYFINKFLKKENMKNEIN